jgi:hypothetical protein
MAVEVAAENKPHRSPDPRGPARSKTNHARQGIIACLVAFGGHNLRLLASDRAGWGFYSW